MAAGAPRIAVVQFPGTNCERETTELKCLTGQSAWADLLWHAEPFPVARYVAVVLPGGFAHGDHLRAGAIARFSPVMPGIQQFAAAGGLVLGICNGFQVLLEAGLLPGAMLRNASLQFRSEWVWCRVERTDTAFTSACTVGQVLRLPIAHGEGNYVSPVDPDPEGVVLRYCDADGNITTSANPNGSRDNIAGLINAAGNVFGLMPHPRAGVLSSARQHRRPVPPRVAGAFEHPSALGRSRLPHAPRGSRGCAAPVARRGTPQDETMTALKPDLRAFGLLPAEYEQILASLGREPNLVELGMLGAMWSEHCGYKHSRKLLKLLPTSGPRVLQGPGENAGAVDIGDGLAVVLKMESHNHPSAVEPFQGAATGVGGILRDIFTMGARPVALLDSLRFGDPSDPRTQYLLGGVIGGIGHYGNCIGVPTVGGEISFDAGYAGNPIVNAMCVGVAPIGRLTRARAQRTRQSAAAGRRRHGSRRSAGRRVRLERRSRGQPPRRGPGGQPVPGEAAARGVPGGAR